jgi:hypothetical protein
MEGLILGDITANGFYGNARNFKEAVRVATIIHAQLNTGYRNHSTIDGVTLKTHDRILIKNQNDAKENGIYIVNSVGAPTRSEDMTTNAPANSFMVTVKEGIQNKNTIWVCNSPHESDIVGDDDILWQLMSDTDHFRDTDNPHSTSLEQTRRQNNYVQGNIIFDNIHTITGIPTPQVPSDVVNMQYVNDQKLHMIDPRTAISNVVYDDNDRVVQVNYANGEQKSITYNNNDTVKQVSYTDRNGVTTSKRIVYDVHGRIIATDKTTII